MTLLGTRLPAEKSCLLRTKKPEIKGDDPVLLVLIIDLFGRQGRNSLYAYTQVRIEILSNCLFDDAEICKLHKISKVTANRRDYKNYLRLNSYSCPQGVKI